MIRTFGAEENVVRAEGLFYSSPGHRPRKTDPIVWKG